MNWIETMYDLRGRDPYSQNGEGLYLEYTFHQINRNWRSVNPISSSVDWRRKTYMDIGGGDGFYLSNTRHLLNLGWKGKVLDKINGLIVTEENICSFYNKEPPSIISIDIDGNDYWVLQKMLSHDKAPIVIAEFNPAFTDSRAIKYNPDHVWAGDDYYGFSFEAGVKLAERFGYKVIFQVADMNMIMVRADLITVPVPPVTFKQNDFFAKSNRTDWEFI